MYGKVKLSKRQIKEDKFTAFMLNAKHQFLENWQFYIIGIIIVILLAFGIVYFINMQKSQKVEAADMYSQGVSEYRQQNFQLAITTFQSVIEDYSGTESAELSTYMVGQSNLVQQSYPEAIRYFQMYLDKYKDNKIDRAASYAGIGTALENQGQYAEAADKFVAAFNEDTLGPLIGDYQMATMRNYILANDMDNAKVHLDKIKELFPGTDLEKRAIRFYAEHDLKK